MGKINKNYFSLNRQKYKKFYIRRKSTHNTVEQNFFLFEKTKSIK